MAGEVMDILFRARMDVSDVATGVGQIQRDLKKLELPKDITDNLEKGFNKVTPLIKEYQKILSKETKTPKDIKNLETLKAKIHEVMGDIKVDLNQINSTKIQPKADLSELKNINKEINSLEKQLSGKMSSLFKGKGISAESAQGIIDKMGRVTSLKGLVTDVQLKFNQQDIQGYTKAVDGLRQMLWGFFKKLVVADNCAVAVNNIWESYTDQSGLALWIAAFLFTFQIYCDFSGYSDIAIGCARLFGINLRRNFDVPYFSRNIQEFWRRWHMSLMTWFRDYVYFPLGGSRCGKWLTARNILIVFLLSGLWHGANWTFVLWGLYHGMLLSLLFIIGSGAKYKDIVADGRWLPSLKEAGQMIVTFIMVLIGWIIFRAENISQLAGIGSKLFSSDDFFNLYGSGLRADIFVFIGFMLIAEWLQRTKQHVLQFPDT